MNRRDLVIFATAWFLFAGLAVFLWIKPRTAVTNPAPLYLTEFAGPPALFPDATTAAVTLAWDANPESNIAYRLYHGPATGIYPEQVTTNTTTATVANVTPGTTKFFAVSAVNSVGIEGQLSAEVVYPVPAAGASPTPTPPGTPTPTPTPSPGITLIPPAIEFTSIQGGLPTATPYRITTTNGAAWATQDTSPWVNLVPTSGASGASFIATPVNTQGLAPAVYTSNLKMTAAGLPERNLTMKLTIVAAATPTAAPTPTGPPSPTSTPTAAPTASPTPTPTATPTATPTPTATATPSSTPTPTAAPTATPTPTPPPFTMTCSPMIGTLSTGSPRTVSFTVTFTRRAGFSSPIIMTAAFVPCGAIGNFSPINVTANKSVFKVTADPSLSAGVYVIEIQAQTGTFVQVVRPNLVNP